MRKLGVMIMALIFVSCEDDNQKEIDDQLVGSWKIVEQYRDDIVTTDNYIHVFIGKNIDTGAIMWQDTIQFGSTIFMFTDNGLGGQPDLKSVEVKSENVRDLSGLWSLGGSNDEIKVIPVANEYMDQDTTVNEHRHSFIDFMYFDYKIDKLTYTQLVLTDSNQKLILEKVE